MALLTATLAGLFSVVGGYFGAGFQARHAVAHKLLEYRVGAYGVFLERIDHNRAPAISELLGVGAMVDHLATDWEIQSFENRIAALLKRHDTQDLYWRLNADVNVLRLHGSARVAQICDDILKALLLRDHEINWMGYSPDVVALHGKWKKSQGAPAYGLTARVSDEERLMIVMIAILAQALIQQLKVEIPRSTDLGP